ncbi:hypothetical protein [Caulobacter sp. UC70_42]|uniref:hypothetical protein n=1 Tax=Caulobacter sp. UC70_42 TaxID=3374551 RepID=UPI003757A425
MGQQFTANTGSDDPNALVGDVGDIETHEIFRENNWIDNTGVIGARSDRAAGLVAASFLEGQGTSKASSLALGERSDANSLV